MVSYASQHALVDMWGCQEISDDQIKLTLEDCAKALHCSVLHIHVHRFEGAGGATGFALLAESHISIHTWPEHRFVTADIYSCGLGLIGDGIAVLRSAYAPSAERIQIVDRELDPIDIDS